MGSPITFSGFNNFDFGSILNTIMSAERAPLRALETQKSTLNLQGTAFTTLASKLGALESAIDSLTGASGFNPFAVTSGASDRVGVSSTTGGVAGHYDVVVNNLARAQVSASTTTYGSPDEVIATSGSLTLAVLGNPPVNIPPTALTGSMTVRELADAINADGSSPVSAAVVQAAPGQYRLVLTGRATGGANAFTVSSTLSGGTGVAFGANAVTATDASLTVNNVAITSTTNSIADAIPGVTLDLLREDANTIVGVDVTKSAEEAQGQIDTFVTAYNALMTFMAEQNTAANEGKPSIGRDSLVRGLKLGLTSAMRAEYLGSGTAYTRLSTIGVEFEITGQLSLDAAAFKQAILADPTAVRALFVGTSGSGGVFGALAGQVDDYTKAGGLVQGAKDRLKGQITKINSRLDTMEMQLEMRRITLQREFIAADQLMSQLNSQGGALQGLGNQYRLF